ncbi:TRAP transporter small permease [Brevibacillus sp. B_LB10_24]|uniref:TRAP transporter small permease n=1 Tax=Brevibacillus sp. B_LB10_24 TaxID=3380645 RepID=UPI0038B9A1B9
MRLIRQFCQRLLKWLLTAMLLTMTLVIFAQVISRYFLHYPLVWSEELSLLLLIWITFLGSVLVLERQEHIGIDVLVERFPERGQEYVRLVGSAFIFIFNCTVTYGGVLIVNTSLGSTTSGMKISVAWQYAGIMVGGLLLALVSLGQMYTSVQALWQARGNKS